MGWYNPSADGCGGFRDGEKGLHEIAFAATMLCESAVPIIHPNVLIL